MAQQWQIALGVSARASSQLLHFSPLGTAEWQGATTIWSRANPPHWRLAPA